MLLSERLMAALDRSPPDLLRADLDPDEWPDAAPAAVLVAVTDRPESDNGPGPGILLTRRAAGMRNHAGQVSFPGGRIDDGEDEVAAALREAEEEIALPRDKVRVLGALDSYVTGTGYFVRPILALVPPDLPLVPNPAEVEQLFEVPIATLLDPARQKEEETAWRGRQRRYWRIDYEEEHIWGATAAMIVNLSRRLSS